jgi:4-diphosphocytidyl-2-C-methyl-D-erythritol kinase
MKQLRLNAYAKINLTLDVLGDRPDGYHDIETVLHTVELHDTIILRENGEGIVLRCLSPDVPPQTQNIVHRAAHLLKETFQIGRGIEIDLTKRIPVAAGLGGGSSDAAVTLLGLAQMWKLRMNNRQLMDLGSKIGSDVPFFLIGGAALAAGRGERVRMLPPLPTTWIVIARPTVHVTSEWAYKAIDHGAVRRRPNTPGVVRALETEDPHTVGQLLCNVFEDVVVAQHPVVGAIRDRLASFQPLGVSLSGTGPAVFAMAVNESAAKTIAAGVAEIPDVDVFVTRTFAEER